VEYVLSGARILAAASSYELKNKSERVWSVEALDRLE